MANPGEAGARKRRPPGQQAKLARGGQRPHSKGGNIMKSVFGLEENVVAALSYIFGPFSGIAVLIMERENKFVRFHALQSMIWFLVLLVVGIILGVLSGFPILGFLFSFVNGLVRILGFVSWVYLMFMAYKGAEFKIPILGDAVWNYVNK
jgi:uncharacterized membrane protein